MTDQAEETAPAPADDPPRPLVAGRYAVYCPPDGSLVVAYRTDDQAPDDPDRHLQIPQWVIQTAAQTAGMDIGALVAQLRGGGS